VWVEVDPGLLTAAGSALLAEGEAALVGALGWLRPRLGRTVPVGIAARGVGGVLPVGGLGAVGPGRPNHAWLAELAELLGMRGIHLDGWTLSPQDLEALVRQDSMRELHLKRCRVQPLPALPLLGRARSLRQLNLDVPSLTGCMVEGEAEAEDEAEDEAAAVLLRAGRLRSAVVALYMLGWRGRLVMSLHGNEHMPRVRVELEAAERDLAAVGVWSNLVVGLW
jgi:hypothetical protein